MVENKGCGAWRRSGATLRQSRADRRHPVGNAGRRARALLPVPHCPLHFIPLAEDARNPGASDLQLSPGPDRRSTGPCSPPCYIQVNRRLGTSLVGPRAGALVGLLGAGDRQLCFQVHAPLGAPSGA